MSGSLVMLVARRSVDGGEVEEKTFFCLRGGCSAVKSLTTAGIQRLTRLI